MTQSLLSQLRKIEPHEFEHLVADLWEEIGFQTEVIQQSQDRGIDVRATNQLGQKHLIQVKRHGPNSVVGGPKIREYAGLYRQENGVDEVYVVTTNGFTSQARDTADSAGVELVDNERLIELITQNDTDQILSGHLPKPESDSESESQSEQSSTADTNTSQSRNGEVSSAKEIQSIDPYGFEKLVAELWETKGYETNVCKKSNNKGIDIEDIDAERGGISEKIQVKRYGQSNKIGSADVRKCATIYQYTNANNVALVTSDEVTDPARELAREMNVDLCSGKELVQQLESSSVDISDYTESESRSERSSTAGTKIS